MTTNPTPAILTLADLVSRLDGIDPDSLTYQRSRGWVIGFTSCQDFEVAVTAFPGQRADRVDYNMVAKRFLVAGNHDFELNHPCHAQLPCWMHVTLADVARRHAEGYLDLTRPADRELLRALTEVVDVAPLPAAARLAEVYRTALHPTLTSGSAISTALVTGLRLEPDSTRHQDLVAILTTAGEKEAS